MLLENTSLHFKVCNNPTGGCSNVRSTTTTATFITNGMTSPNSQQDQTIIIIILASLAGLIVLALMLLGFICWKRKHNQALAKHKGTSKCHFYFTCFYFNFPLIIQFIAFFLSHFVISLTLCIKTVITNTNMIFMEIKRFKFQTPLLYYFFK